MRQRRRTVDKLYEDTIMFGRLAAHICSSNELDLYDKALFLAGVVEMLAMCEEESRLGLMEEIQMVRGLS